MGDDDILSGSIESKGIEKLMGLVAAGVGAVYRPRAIRQEANARSYEIVELAKAQAIAEVEANKILLAGKIDTLQMLETINPGLVARARARLLSRELEGQLNIEGIVDAAARHMPSDVSEDAVMPDWRRKFFSEAENICDRDVQQVWGKLLAGEVSKPGSFGVRTIGVLANLTKREAELFHIACSLAAAGGMIFLMDEHPNQCLQPYGLHYNNIMELRQAGLVGEGDSIYIDFRPGNVHFFPNDRIFSFGGIFVKCSGIYGAQIRLHLLNFTAAGVELMKVVDASPNLAYLGALGNYLRTKCSAVKRGRAVKVEGQDDILDFSDDL